MLAIRIEFRNSLILRGTRQFCHSHFPKNVTLIKDAFDALGHNHIADLRSVMPASIFKQTKQHWEMVRSAAPNIRIRIDDVISEGDKVVTRWTARGTHHGDWMGIAATRKPISLTGINIYTVRQGKLSQSHVNWDMLGLMRQLGVISA